MVVVKNINIVAEDNTRSDKVIELEQAKQRLQGYSEKITEMGVSL